MFGRALECVTATNKCFQHRSKTQHAIKYFKQNFVPDGECKCDIAQPNVFYLEKKNS